MQRILIGLGILLLLLGLLWPLLSGGLGKLPLGRLPGDIVIKREGFSFYFPLTTMILISAALSLLLWLFRR